MITLPKRQISEEFLHPDYWSSFDELPCRDKSVELDWSFIRKYFNKKGKRITQEQTIILGLIKNRDGHTYPSNGSILLFGKNRLQIFPNAFIRCVHFSGIDSAKIIDQVDLDSYPVLAIQEAIKFIEDKIVSEYPAVAIRESIMNAVLHADYSIKGSPITIAIFDDRIEIANPGGLVACQALKHAISGSTQLRNHVIGLTLRELKLIERWGVGFPRIINSCASHGLRKPKIKALKKEFRITIYSTPAKKRTLK